MPCAQALKEYVAHKPKFFLSAAGGTAFGAVIAGMALQGSIETPNLYLSALLIGVILASPAISAGISFAAIKFHNRFWRHDDWRIKPLSLEQKAFMINAAIGSGLDLFSMIVLLMIFGNINVPDRLIYLVNFLGNFKLQLYANITSVIITAIELALAILPQAILALNAYMERRQQSSLLAGHMPVNYGATEMQTLHPIYGRE